jgi:hypothetical protein
MDGGFCLLFTTRLVYRVRASTVVLAGITQRAQAQGQTILLTRIELSSVGTCALLQIMYVARLDHSEFV